jgi:hypothetical protein
MALGEFTKQIAQQAILSATSKEPAPPAPAQPQGENVSGVFMAQIHAMQKALKDDEELVLHYNAGGDKIRVLEIFAPSRRVLVLTGVDAERNHVRVIAAAESLQLVSRVVKVAAGAKAMRIGLVTPKQ